MTLRSHPSHAGCREAPTLRASVAALLVQQRETWPLLRAATVALAHRPVQAFPDQRLPTVIAQYNPQRLVSTAARVDAASIRARRCFLCADHLPPEERGLALGDDFVILCNPFPVLPNHLVIAGAPPHDRRPSRAAYETLLDLAAALGARLLGTLQRAGVRRVGP